MKKIVVLVLVILTVCGCTAALGEALTEEDYRTVYISNHPFVMGNCTTDDFVDLGFEVEEEEPGIYVLMSVDYEDGVIVAETDENYVIKSMNLLFSDDIPSSYCGYNTSPYATNDKYVSELIAKIPGATVNDDGITVATMQVEGGILEVLTTGRSITISLK